MMNKSKKKLYQIKKKIQQNFKQGEQSKQQVVKKKKKSTHHSQQQVQQQDKKNKQSQSFFEKINPQINYPMLQFQNSQIKFQQLVGIVDLKELIIKNIGNSVVYYQWVKCSKQKSINFSVMDQNTKFSCFHQNNVIKPGQVITFVFSFLSKIPGIFVQYFVLKCRPKLFKPIPKIKLTGYAQIIDPYKQLRNFLQNDLTNVYIQNGIKQIVYDVIDQVKTPTPPLPDFQIEQVREKQFQQKNKKYGLWYNQIVFKWWKNLQVQLEEFLEIPQQQRQWDFSVDYIRKMIERVKDQVYKQCLIQRFQDYFNLSRKRPYKRSPIYNQIYNILTQIACQMQSLNDGIRKQLEMWEFTFHAPQQQEISQQVRKAKEDELTKIKNEWLKKAKKKKWGQQQQKQLIQNYRNKYCEKIKQCLDNKMNGLQQKEEFLQFIEISKKQKYYHSKRYFQFLQRFQCVKDVDIQNRRVLIRVNLKISEQQQKLKIKNHFQQFLIKMKLQQQKIEQSVRLELEKLKDKKRKKQKKKQQESFKQLVKQTFDITQFLDIDNLNQILNLLNYCLEKNARYIILVVSYDRPLGQYNYTKSLKFFYEYLKQNLEYTVQFNQKTYIDDFEQKLQMQTFTQNSVILLQNIFFNPNQINFKIQQDNMIKLQMYDKKQFLTQFSKYAQVFINQNKQQWWNNYTLDNYLKTQSNILGLSAFKYLSFVSNLFLNQRTPFLVVVGGNISKSKLLAMKTLVWYADQIIVVGRIGILFYMVLKQLKNFFGIQIKDYQIKSIKQFFKQFDRVWEEHIPQHKRQPEPKRAKLTINSDFLICVKPQSQKVITQYIDQLKDKIQNFSYQQQKQIPQNSIIIDIGNLTVNEILQKLKRAKKIFILDHPNQNKFYYEHSFLKLFRKLFQLKNIRIQNQSQDPSNDFYKQCQMIFISGFIKQEFNKLKFQQILFSKNAKLEINQQQQVSQQEQVMEQFQIKQNAYVSNIQKVCDLSIGQSRLITQIISGQYIPILQNLQRHKKKEIIIQQQ